MVKEVKPTEVLLKEYKDKELIHYVTQELRSILFAPSAEGEPYEALVAQKMEAIGGIVLPILTAVDKRMNGDSNELKVVL